MRVRKEVTDLALQNSIAKAQSRQDKFKKSELENVTKLLNNITAEKEAELEK